MVTADRELIFVQNNDVFVKHVDESAEIEKMQGYAEDDEARVHSEGQDINDATLRFKITDAFKLWLFTQTSWKDIADGHFEQELADAMTRTEKYSGSSSDAKGTYDPSDY